MTIIEAKRNLFGGCVIEHSDLPERSEDFSARLEYSLGIWRAEGIKVVWLELSLAQAHLIPLCTALGFKFHHAEDDLLQMTLTLVPGSTVPPYATHYIGAGGVVINEANELLVVSERYRQVSGRRLKLPGGTLQQGEHLAAAVVREVKEETGIETRFEYVVSMRHWHGYRYGKSDIYFICRLTPLTTEIFMDSREIAECLWLPLNEFLADKDVHSFNKLVVKTAAESQSGLAEKHIGEYNKETHELLIL